MDVSAAWLAFEKEDDRIVWYERLFEWIVTENFGLSAGGV